MAFATFLSRILGLVREQVMAATFGATGLTDAYLVAFRIPNILRDLFAEGSFSPAFVPIFIEERIKDPKTSRNIPGSIVPAMISLLANPTFTIGIRAVRGVSIRLGSIATIASGMITTITIGWMTVWASLNERA